MKNLAIELESIGSSLGKLKEAIGRKENPGLLIYFFLLFHGEEEAVATEELEYLLGIFLTEAAESLEKDEAYKRDFKKWMLRDKLEHLYAKKKLWEKIGEDFIKKVAEIFPGAYFLERPKETLKRIQRNLELSDQVKKGGAFSYLGSLDPKWGLRK